MRRKRPLLFILLIVVLGALVYWQVRAWRRFDWEKFKDGAEGIRYWRVLLAVALVYVADGLRALRWKIFLRPRRPGTSWLSLIAPQYIGFTGLALLGRPGEFIRPYLIAKRVNTTMAEQVAIWLVERVFDTAAVVLFFTVAVFTSHSLRDLERYEAWRRVGYIAAPLVLLFIFAVWALWARGASIAAWARRRASRISPAFGSSVEKRLQSLTAGLHTIKDISSLLQLTLLSLAIWGLIAVSYRAVMHAFPAYTDLPSLNFAEVVLLMFVSVAGGVITLPVVGGGSQLATIAVLSQTFGYADTPELAVACGMLLWLVTFMSIIPGGLLLAHREHISLRRLETEAGVEAKSEEAALPPLPLP